MDYGTLAQLSSPGQTPLTSGIVDPVGYQRWMNLSDMQQQALQRAMPLAEMNSEQQALSHEAFKAAQPARMNQSTLANMNTASAIEAQPGEAELKQNTTKALNEEQKRKMADVLAPLGQFADAMDAAKTPEEQAQIWKAIDMQGITLPNGYKLSSQDRETGMALLKASRGARENTPALSTKRDIAESTMAGKLANTNLNNASREKIASMLESGRNDRARQLNEIKQALTSSKPMNLSQGTYAYIQALYGDDLEGALKAIQVLQSGGAGVNNQTKLDIANKLGVPMPNQAGQMELPPSNKQGPAPGAKAPVADKKAALKDLKVGSPFNGKKVKGIGRNAKGEVEQVLLDDGTVETIK